MMFFSGRLNNSGGVMGMERKCLVCDRPLPGRMRSDAVFGSDRCRQVWHRSIRHLQAYEKNGCEALQGKKKPRRYDAA